MSLCGARTRSGGVCKRYSLKGRRRCSNHGGASLRNEQHWNWKHGRCTIDRRKSNKEATARIKQIKLLMIQLGMIDS